MSSTAGAGASKGPAPWKAAFLEDVNKHMDSPEFVLATLHATPEGSSTPYIPHARFCIFRGMWGELPENKHYDGPKNERIFESELPTFTTDVRMEKFGEIMESSPGGKPAGREGVGEKSQKQAWGSGGGGPVEAVFWVKEKQIQWRVKGEAFLVGPDVEGDKEENSGVRTVKSELAKRMHIVQHGKEGDWSWATEVTHHFGNLSPGMRGSFKQPPPGQARDKPYPDENKMGEKLSGLDDPVARKNFRVVVIRPEKVEELNLDPEKAGRKKYTYNEETTDWDLEETWP